MSEFVEGDLVAVFGGEFGKDARNADAVSIGKVLVVGYVDLIVEWSNSYTSTCHIVPKSICHKLHIEPEIVFSAAPLVPKVSDLVVSFSRARFNSKEADKVTGILYKITYKLGKPDKCTLLCGTEMIDTAWDSLVVLHRPGSKSDSG